MRASVLAGFEAFTERFEGRTDWLYLDVKGLVTIGLGNLVDPCAQAMALDFLNPDGSGAAWADVAAAWSAVKARQDLRLHGGGAFRGLTRVRATPASIAKLVRAKLGQFESVLRTAFPEWDTWPARAQLGCLSMAWAMGPHFAAGWPKFAAACLAQDWAGAAQNCRMNDAENPGLRPRNTANIALFEAAAHAVATGGDPEELCT